MNSKKKATALLPPKRRKTDGDILLLEKRVKKQALLADRKNKEIDLLRSMIDVLPDCHIFLKDRESRFITTNGYQLKLLGITSLEDVVGKSDFDFFPRAMARKFFNDEQKIIRTGKPMINREEETVTVNGEKHWFITTKVPLYFHHGAFSGLPGGKNNNTKNIAGIVGLSRDITALKKLEREREKLIKELRQALDKIKTLHGLIPICCACKKIRDDKGYWQQIEMYMHEHADAEFSHGYCPECARKALAEIGPS